MISLKRASQMLRNALIQSRVQPGTLISMKKQKRNTNNAK